MALSGSLKTNDYNGRYYIFSWSAEQSITNNNTLLTWSFQALGGSATWYAERTLELIINGTTAISKTERVERHAGYIRQNYTMSIPHNADGSKSFDVSIKVACYKTSVNLKASTTFVLDDIPRHATLVSAPNFTDEGNPTITYSNPAGTAVNSLQACISLDGSAADIAYRDVPMNGTSYTFNLTDTERNVLRNATTTSNSRTVKFYLVTVIGSIKYTETLTKTLSIVNANPTISATITDSNSTTVALTGSNAKFIKYYSNAAYSITATGLKGATITSRKITVGSKSSTAASGTINAVESGSFVISVTDSRGNSTTKTITKTLIEYIKLTGVIKVSNPVADSGTATLTVSGKYFNGSFGSKSNSLTVKYRVKAGTGSYGSWITASATSSGNAYTATVALSGLDYMTSYTCQASIADGITTVTTGEYTVRSTPVFDWDADDFNFNVPVTCAKGITASGINTISGTDNDTVSNWAGYNLSYHYYNTLNSVIDQPNQYGFLLNVGRAGNTHQLWLSQPQGDILHRGGNQNGWSAGEGYWRKMLDSSNYHTLALPLTGGTTNGYVKLGNTVNTVGQFRFNTEWMGVYSACTDAQLNDNRKGWFGFDGTKNFSVVNESGGANVTSIAWTVYSDKRLKTNIEDIPDVLISVWEELFPKTFKWNALNNGNDKTQFGLIAQDVIAAFDKYGLDYRDYGFVVPYSNSDNNEEYFGVSYDAYHMLTAAALRRTKTIVEEYGNQISEMRKEIDALKKLISESTLKSEEEYR